MTGVGVIVGASRSRRRRATRSSDPAAGLGLHPDALRLRALPVADARGARVVRARIRGARSTASSSPASERRACCSGWASACCSCSSASLASRRAHSGLPRRCPRRALVRLRAARARLAVLHASVLAPTLRAWGPGGAASARLRRRRAPQPADPAARPRDVAAKAVSAGSRVAGRVPRRVPDRSTAVGARTPGATHSGRRRLRRTHDRAGARHARRHARGRASSRRSKGR